MTSVLITITLAVVLGSLWIRRGTLRSPWEAGANLNIALQGCAVLLMSPWAATTFGPGFHRYLGIWNVQHLLGHVCLIVAAAAVIHHGMARLSDETLAMGMYGRHVVEPLKLGVPLLVAVFIVADETYHADLFAAHVGTFWLGAYWLLLGGMLIYLFGYMARILLIVRADAGSRATADLYLTAAILGAAATVIQVGTAWVGIDVSLPVWWCGCLTVIAFAYGAVRSWRARIGWFRQGDQPPAQPAQ